MRKRMTKKQREQMPRGPRPPVFSQDAHDWANDRYPTPSGTIIEEYTKEELNADGPQYAFK